MDASWALNGHLANVFRLKFGSPNVLGPLPRVWRRLGYYTPDEFYEATVLGLVQSNTRWLDVGCGRDVFPNNRNLARLLANRCALLFGVDPDENIEENDFVHRRAKTTIDRFQCEERFDLVTLRMVAEHIPNPAQAVEALARLTLPGGKVLLYTVNSWSPVSLAARLTPLSVRHRIKRVLWRTEERDTFRVEYRMNTRAALRDVFGRSGFREKGFCYLDDCRTFYRFRHLHLGELLLCALCQFMGFSYPENCLLGVYERT
jgi:2-polyprenyl-3-methyl-5-hydroxy-6-metoxy-1,4-benzoquinol methylase